MHRQQGSHREERPARAGLPRAEERAGLTAEVLRIAISPGTRTSIVLEGELDFNTSKQLRRALDGLAKPADATFDLTGLEFIDSSGLSIMASDARKLLPGGTVTVVVPKASMRRLFTVTALDSVLTIVERAPD
jgi:anti-anti-sigma factor